MLLQLPIGSTSKIIQFPIFDSSSTTGALLTGLAFNSASLTAYYSREGVTGAAVAITLATTTKGTWATGGFVAVDGTNMPGWYELHIPDAALASGAKSVSIHLKGATNMVPVPILIELTATSNQNATTGGITNIDAAVTSRMATYTQPTGFLAATFPGTVASTTNITAGTITTVTTLTGHTPQTGDNYVRLGAPAGASVSADVAAVKVDTAAVKVKTDFLPSATAGAAGGVFIAGTNAATTITTALTTTFTGNVTGSVGSVTGAVGSVTGSVGSVTGAVGSVTGAVGSVTGNVGGNVTGSVGSVAAGGIASTSFAASAITAAALATDAGQEIADAVLLRKLDRSGTGTDATDERTVVNALRGLRNKVSISGGTATVTKEDDTTTAWTATVATTAGNPISSIDPT